MKSSHAWKTGSAPTKGSDQKIPKEGGFHRPLCFWAWVFCLFSTPSFSFSFDLLTRANPALCLSKGEAFVLASASYHTGSHYFTEGSSKTETLPDDTRERYHDASLSLTLGYGLLSNLTLLLHVPAVYRAETRSYQAKDWGLGDVSTAIRVDVFHDEIQSLALDMYAKFPTADSNIGRSDELPLGDGMTDLGPVLTWLQRKNRWSFEESVGYVFRSMARVEYLTTQNFRFTDSNGNNFDLPVGNLRIGFGNALNGAFSVRRDFSTGISLLAGARYMYRENTTVENFAFSSTGGSTDSTVAPIRLGRSQLLVSTLSLRYALKNGWLLRASWEHPWWGENAPIPTLSFVESMIGERVSFGASHAF